MNRKPLTGLIAAVVTLFLVAYFASPILAVRALTRAAKSGDEAALTRLVDFPEFRDSLKGELNSKLVDRMRADPRSEDPVLSGLGRWLAPALVSGVVDAFVTPAAVATMVRTAEAPDPVDRQPRPAPAESNGEDGRDIHQTWRYRDLNTFAVGLSNKRHPDQYLVLLMQRRGLFGWQLAGIDLTAPSEDDPI